MRIRSLLATTAMALVATTGMTWAQPSDSPSSQTKNPPATSVAPTAPEAKGASPAQTQNDKQVQSDKKTGLDRADQAAGEKGMLGRDKAREAQSDSKSKSGQKAADDRMAPAKSADDGKASNERRQPSTAASPAPSKSATDAKSGSDVKVGSDQKAGAAKASSDPKTSSDTKAGSPTGAGTSSSTSSQSASTNVTAEQATKVNEAISRVDVKPETRVNFSVSVGINVPSRVSLHPLPSTLVTILPQYRGYNYFVVEDRVVIVEPRTRKIVTVIDRRGGSTVGMRTPSRVQFSDMQRRMIREKFIRGGTRAQAPANLSVKVGETLPSSYTVQEFPVEIYSEIPELRTYRYVVFENELVLVDPTERRIVEIID